MELDQAREKPMDDRDRKHVNDIWNRFESYRSGKAAGIGYALPQLNPFANWRVSDRYANQSHFDRARAEARRDGATVVRRLINQAGKDGLI